MILKIAGRNKYLLTVPDHGLFNEKTSALESSAATAVSKIL
jgi:hypothetical protein